MHALPGIHQCIKETRVIQQRVNALVTQSLLRLVDGMPRTACHKAHSELRIFPAQPGPNVCGNHGRLLSVGADVSRPRTHTAAPCLLLSVRGPRDRSRRPVFAALLLNPSASVLYLAIPAHNEVATIGVLLWRLRSVLAEFPREYEVVVYDDASSDETADVAEQYVQSMPVTVLRGTKSVGYAGAVDALIRHVSGHTRYPRRDAMLLLQGDFTDPPGIVPEFARRFEGGADLVIGERTAVVDAPSPVRRLFTAAGWALRPFVRVDGVRDLTGSMRLIRVSVLRDALRNAGDTSICEGDSWTANADLLLRLVPHARRVESVPMEPTYGVRMRDSRRVIMRDALAALRWGWRARGRRAAPTSAPESTVEPAPRNARGTPPTSRRREEPELSVDRLRERTRDRGRGDSSLEEAPVPGRRDGRRTRDAASEQRGARPSSDEPISARSKRSDNPTRTSATIAPASESVKKPEPESLRVPREGRNSRQRPKDVSPAIESSVGLTDPFAAPANSARQRAPRAVPKATPAPATPPTEPRTEPRAESPYADEPARERRMDVDDAASRIEIGENAIESQASADEGDDAAETSDSAVGADDMDARERKRRRNRRSRRRKSKSRAGGVVDAGPDDAAPSAASTNDAERTLEHPLPGEQQESRRPERNRDENSDDTGVVAGDDATDSVADDGVDAQTRSRRRGRRGRRGGARRARGRGRDADGSDPAAPEASSADTSPKADASSADTSTADAASNEGTRRPPHSDDSA